jgi:hypothetical protein
MSLNKVPGLSLGVQMSLLNFMLNKEAIYVVSDTLASYPEDMEPRAFTTKVYTVPHLEGLICGTGIGQFVLEWYGRVVERLVVRDMHNLDDFAPESLCEIWERYRTAVGREMSSTIYHFGYDRIEDKFVGWAYRSGNGFASQSLAYGNYFKPDDVGGAELEIKELEDFTRIAEMQKAADRAKPIEGQVGIGGHLISHLMMARKQEREEEEVEIITTISRFHQFDDWGSDWMRACDKLPSPPDASEES